ncbi:MAG: HlyD family efflux transporter periplasmic adaptor subunit [Proteobacteria bacterium]|nr:HlyD family efflux transporter periplasmic adaptor subunit [Pseudomonadota bacterium]
MEEKRTTAARPRRRLLLVVAVVLVALAAVGGGWWATHRAPPIPAGFAVSNGRLEEDEIDIQTKFAGRVAEILVDEGAVVRAGQVLARMDTSDMETQLAKARADVAQAEHVIATARTDLEQARSVWALAQAEVSRTAALVPKGFATKELLDQRVQALDAAIASYNGVNARISAATAARESALQSARLIEVNIADNTLRAPRDGIVQYRLANLGEVLPAGGKLFTVLDTNYAYMDIFLPTAQAGRAAVGTEARIVLDADPGHPLPAHVSFVAQQNQFTPKMVETAVEREKLMFRVRIRVDAQALGDARAPLQAGQPGLAFVRLDPKAPWPAAAAGMRR